MANQIPDEITNNPLLNKMIEQVWIIMSQRLFAKIDCLKNLHPFVLLQLPANYNFEIHKSVWRIQKAEAKKGNYTVWVYIFAPPSMD